MAVIKQLGERVEREHNQFLRDAQRIEDRSAMAVNGTTGAPSTVTVDFESLVGREGVGGTINSVISQNTGSNNSASWDDDVWGSIFKDSVRSLPYSTYWILIVSSLLRRLRVHYLIFSHFRRQLHHLYQLLEPPPTTLVQARSILSRHPG